MSATTTAVWFGRSENGRRLTQSENGRRLARSENDRRLGRSENGRRLYRSENDHRLGRSDNGRRFCPPRPDYYCTIMDPDRRQEPRSLLSRHCPQSQWPFAAAWAAIVFALRASTRPAGGANVIAPVGWNYLHPLSPPAAAAAGSDLRH